ncbi:type II secretion system minor pseudopilin GspH [Marinobacter sp. LN3S78]|uniref:type II secretion system minor pseudopilin GspH n=1 Tax=Marinobacter sp. LN3S78 TaxID=3382300 RepID=UPI00387B4B14
MSHREPRQSGFTMIEILVVLVLVGLLASLAIVNLGGGREQREMTSKIRELYVLMQTASEQAILNSEELGLVIDEEGYRFVVFDELEREWASESARLFQGRGFPEWMSVTLFTNGDIPRLAKGEDDEDEENRLRPDIVFYSSGETTPFELEFLATMSPDQIYRLESDGLNEIDMKTPGDDGGNF